MPDVEHIDPADYPPHPETIKFAREVDGMTLPQWGRAFGLSAQEVIDEIWANRLRPFSHTTIAPKPPEDGWTAQDYLQFSVITEQASREWMVSGSHLAVCVACRAIFEMINAPR